MHRLTLTGLTHKFRALGFILSDLLGSGIITNLLLKNTPLYDTIHSVIQEVRA